MLINSTRHITIDRSDSKTPDLSQSPQDSEDTPGLQDDYAPLAGDAGHRIGHFVRSATQESLQHLRYLSTANAFQNVGSALGSVALSPLAIKFANDNATMAGGIGIGGTIAAGAVGALVGYAWLHHRDGQKQDTVKKFSQIHDTALTVGTAIQSLPKFIYPTVLGGTEAQRDTIYAALDKLPLHQATASATMQVVPDLVSTGISGMAQPGASHVHILLDESRLNSVRGGDLVLHEQAHAVDYSGGFGLVGAHNWKSGFGKAPFVSNYAGSNRYEDFAESFEAYTLDPEGFTAKFPAKAAALEKISHPDLVSKSADNKTVREAGKRVGTTLGKVPYLRTGVELGLSLVAPIQVYRGADKLIGALESGDSEQALDGKLTLASGLFMSLPGARPMALATGIAASAIRATAGDNDGEYSKTADKWANRVLSASAGPVGMAAAAVTGELLANGMRMDATSGFVPEGWQAARPSKANMLKGTLATVGGTVGGALLGAAAGGALGGNSGAVLGALWGQAAGGALGLAGYGIHRALNNENSAQNPLALTHNDKTFLRGTVGGAVVGGAVGTAGGAIAGSVVGQLTGNLLGSASTGQILGSVGGWMGGLAGAYGGAKLGAGVGSGRLTGKQLLQDVPPSERWKNVI